MFWFVYLQISLSQIGLNVYNLLKVNSLLKALLAKPFLHADFSPLANSSRQLTILSAVNVFVAWIKVFKYLSFNKTMIQLSETLSGVSQTLLSSTIFWKKKKLNQFYFRLEKILEDSLWCLSSFTLHLCN